MKSNFRKTNLADSDQTAREKHAHGGNENVLDPSANIEGLQTSNKTGKHSSAEKLAASRPEFGPNPGAKPVDGAFGDDANHRITGREASPETNQFRCSGCGRYLNSAEELAQHEAECRAAKAATTTGREDLRNQDATPHARNDAESKARRFQHGTKAS